MPRGLSEDQKTAAKARDKRPAMFIELDLPDKPVYAWDGAFPVLQRGHTFIGVGQFGLVEGLGGERAVRANAIRIGLHGLPTDKMAPDFLKNASRVSYRGRALRILMGFCDLNTDEPLAPPYLHWSGSADVLSSRVGKTISVTLTGDNYSSHLRRTNGLRMSHESHAKRIGRDSDNFFKFTNRLLAKPKAL